MIKSQVMDKGTQYRLILTGTDPISKSGGIGIALSGYLSSLESTNISFESIPTYSPSSLFSRHFLFLFALPKIIQSILRSNNSNQICIVYSHAGADISLLREGIIAIFGRICGAKTVMHIHSSESIGYLASPLKKWLFFAALIGVQCVFVLTPWAKEKYLRGGLRKAITVIPNPMPIAWERTAQKARNCPRFAENIKVLVMTRLIEGKGVDLVIDTTPYLASRVQLDIAGDGPQLESLRTRVMKLKQEDYVEFCGWVTGEEKQTLLDDADVFCHPTTLDAMPMNILEAMANGLPVVALKWGPIADLVPDRVAGLLVDTPDPREMATAILTLNDSKVRERMGREAKRWVLNNFSSQLIGTRLDSAFKIIARG